MTFIAFLAIFLVGVFAGSLATILIAVRMDEQRELRMAAATAQPQYIDVESWIVKHGQP